jgi:NADH:ubiquinone reductase (H+-translocating)
VFVGAGYAGLEGLAELQDYAANIVDLYPRCRMQGTRWIMIEAAERVLPEISADLANFAVRELQRRGIEIRTGTTVEEVGDRRVQLSDGTEVVTRNVVWTAGVRAHPVVEQLGLPLERGRIKADRFLRV